jgi:hypothetical protein
MPERDFKRVIEEGRALQHRFPELSLVAVGGTAAALHCGHRVSLDVDEVTPRLQERYDQIAAALERWEGWTTNRLNPPVLILGERHGIELGLRQQRRAVPLQTTVAEGLTIPTMAEMLRIKAFLVAERRGTRDYVDLAALAHRLGMDASRQSLAWLNLLYPGKGPQSLVTRFAEACEAEPADLAVVPLPTYKGLRAPFTDWEFVAGICRQLGRELLKRELTDELPDVLDETFGHDTAP